MQLVVTEIFTAARNTSYSEQVLTLIERKSMKIVN